MVWRVTVLAASLCLLASNAAAGADDGLVGRWLLDEGAGQRAADSSGYGNDGTILAGVTWVPGETGSALSFDGTSGAMRVPNSSSLEPSSTVTVTAWVQHDGTPGTYRYILAKGASGCIAASYGLYSGKSGGLEFYVSRDRGTVYATSPDAGSGVWDGRWHSVIGSFDGSVIRLYVDGRLIGAGARYPGSLEYLLPDSNDLYIGDYPGCATHEFRGAVDDVTVWNRALTPAEVTSLSVPGPTSGGPPAPSGQSGQGAGAGSGAPGGTNAPAGTGAGPRTGTAGGSGPGSASATPRSPAPALSTLRISPSTIRVGPGGLRFRFGAGGAGGATVSYVDSQAAQATVLVVTAQRRRCVKRGTVRPGRTCTRWVLVGRLTHHDHEGRNRLSFHGVPGHPLGPGAYRLVVFASADGKTGHRVAVAFAISATGQASRMREPPRE